MGVTHLWSADFDHDGQLDYLIARHFGLGGSCPKRASVLLLLFDELGRPVPWKFETPDPVAVFDADHDGIAEFVAAPCDCLTGKRALGESWIESAFRPAWKGDPTTRIDVLTEPAPHSVADLGGIVLSGGREMPRPEDLILDSPRAAISTSISWTLRSFGCCGTVIR